ncbi:hypothetical protein KHC28_15345 [Ancylobacter sonchi]|uniref:hypothetical protein n=1 Tax=Ancylobacter sonchi TaxID=1937790 RepID=UPI001BD2413C|nr:hypothetical protein [Ancylobacter sonchi]MBS7535028.1 hypothetical protein [Ancylobacter sonchi]
MGEKEMIDNEVVTNVPTKAMTMRKPAAIAQACDRERPLLPSRIWANAGKFMQLLKTG